MRRLLEVCSEEIPKSFSLLEGGHFIPVGQDHTNHNHII